MRIEQTIFVERESQRKIVLGKNGQTIKAIGADSRKELMQLFEHPVHLFLVRQGAGRVGRRSRALSRNGFGVSEGIARDVRATTEFLIGSRAKGLPRWNGPTTELCSAPAVTAKSSAILELMTRGHGRHLGLVRGGSGSRLRPVLQPGAIL